MKKAQRQSATSLRLECIDPDPTTFLPQIWPISAIIECVLGHPTHGFLDRVETPALPGQQPETCLEKPLSFRGVNFLIELSKNCYQLAGRVAPTPRASSNWGFPRTSRNEPLIGARPSEGRIIRALTLTEHPLFVELANIGKGLSCRFSWRPATRRSGPAAIRSHTDAHGARRT